MIKKFFLNRFIIALFSFFLGILAYWNTERLLSKLHIVTQFVTSQNDSANNPEDLTDDQDPFQQMRRMQLQMMNQMRQQALGEPGFGVGGGGPTQASSGFRTREDDQFVYYDIELKGLNPAKFDVKVENGQVNVSGQFERKDEGGGAAITSSFQRTFPVPENTDADKFQVENKGDVITLKFPKRA